ncbi:MAG TPA: hypothetical protein V6C71_00450 [Coleofasciculaceae cyanobacterium]|jgi:hypothetical protein
MTQAIVVKPTPPVKTCSTCPHFNNFYEVNGRGWCKLFDRQAREHHEITNDCIISSDLAVSHELENNLDIFPDINLEELEAFPTEEIIDEADKPHSDYEVGSIVKVIDADEDHTEWAVFEIVECKYNPNLYDSIETYLNQCEWYYRLCSYQDGNTMPSNNFVVDKSLWVREDEICDFDMSWNVCTEEIF